MTGRGLFDALQDAPDAIHVLEDMENLLRDNGALGVLRSALWSQSGKDGRLPAQRLVTWTTWRMQHSFVFTGGIILTANRPFPPRPELEAIKTRIGYFHLLVSDNEMAALMRRVSLDGYCRGEEVMTPEECLEVCNFIIAECRGLHRPLDMRTLINGFQDYCQHREYESSCHWRDLVATRIKERPIALEEAKSPPERVAQQEREMAVALGGGRDFLELSGLLTLVWPFGCPPCGVLQKVCGLVEVVVMLVEHLGRAVAEERRDDRRREPVSQSVCRERVAKHVGRDAGEVRNFVSPLGWQRLAELVELLPEPLEPAANPVSRPRPAHTFELSRRAKERAVGIERDEFLREFPHRRRQVHHAGLAGVVGLVLVEDPHRTVAGDVRGSHGHDFTGAATGV
jgi:hypothetical protein